jgi:hypothetical protein
VNNHNLLRLESNTIVNFVLNFEFGTFRRTGSRLPGTRTAPTFEYNVHLYAAIYGHKFANGKKKTVNGKGIEQRGEGQGANITFYLIASLGVRSHYHAYHLDLNT